MDAALKSPDILDAAIELVERRGWKLLQPFRFAQDDAAHVSVLLGLADFPLGARVLDIGCGLGECARLMQEQSPDLRFSLVNFSATQLARCPAGFDLHHADAHALPFPDESFDAVMFHAALGNMDVCVALAEASRVLKPGGVLLLNEVRRVSGDNAEMERILRFRAYQEEELYAFCAGIGFDGFEMERFSPKVCREYLRDVWDGDPALYDVAFAGTEPAVWRMVKGETAPVAARLIKSAIAEELSNCEV